MSPGEPDLVVGAPRILRELAGSLHDGGAELDDHAGRLGDAAAAFSLGSPDFGGVAVALAEDIAARLLHESPMIVRVGDGVADLADSLEAADRAGFGGPLGSPGLGWGVVVVDAELLATFDIGPHSSLEELHDALRRRRDLLVAAHGRPATFGPRLPDTMADQVDRLDALVRQLDAIVSGRPGGWAGVGSEQWSTAGGFLAAASLGGAQVAARRIEIGVGTGTDRDFHAVVAWAEQHPFLAAAEHHGVAITPARLELLVEIDRLVGLPIGGFLDERERSLGGTSGLDWRSDGCSGPVISTADHHCYRHDFIYRNARMLRDQWGLAPGFAEDLKDLADRRFTNEVIDDSPRWPGRPEPFAWAIGVGAAVRLFGTVATPWTPPEAEP
ncbi:MAG: hypothetical protein ACE367_19370 [Acidimicrobiales bacterium]